MSMTERTVVGLDARYTEREDAASARIVLKLAITEAAFVVLVGDEELGRFSMADVVRDVVYWNLGEWGEPDSLIQVATTANMLDSGAKELRAALIQELRLQGCWGSGDLEAMLCKVRERAALLRAEEAAMHQP